MNSIIYAGLIILFGCDSVPDRSTSLPEASVVFAGTTPCGNVVRPLHGISPEPDCPLEECKCIMVEWELTLYTDANTKEPTRFQLKGLNRYSVKETNMYSEPGIKSQAEGKWAIVKGTKTDPDAIFYQLNPDNPGMSLSFLRLSDSLIHIVDQNKQLMIGNEFFSYTLNRVAK